MCNKLEKREKTVEQLKAPVYALSQLTTEFAIGMSLKPMPDDGRLALPRLRILFRDMDKALNEIEDVLAEYEEDDECQT